MEYLISLYSVLKIQLFKNVCFSLRPLCGFVLQFCVTQLTGNSKIKINNFLLTTWSYFVTSLSPNESGPNTDLLGYTFFFLNAGGVLFFKEIDV